MNPKPQIYIKVHKVGGSTVGGVLRNAARRRGLEGVYSGHLSKEPGVRASHGRMRDVAPFVQKLERGYTLITWLRKPVGRCLSGFWHIQEIWLPC